ncbi:Papain-like cysteine protease AvrRpt2 [Cyclobacterium xiamenense]|uniref:Papain-like cysteine protease AvrRpt2 n=1 Tax=Cyclobacterium xiamenense TaxID=1297121 RepID=A0A1H6U0L9_9BACT|nr:papain-like cysteine protease family protein [Cyclobacterium xiamenense]SEI83077.1 Papain-like cysteine protease AvrRpt2 [Cyclobacterium xiamenense]
MAAIRLDFDMELQRESRLCWAAVSVAIARYYEQPAVPEQIAFAKNVWGRRYNRFFEPDKALAILGNLGDKLDRALRLQEIRMELAQARPIVACMKHFVGWHLVVIYGIDEAGMLSVADSQVGSSQCMLPVFTNEYRLYHSWTHTYKTKKNG